MDLELAGRVALVGGSSRGLGLAIAAALSAEGCRVALNGRNRARLDAAVSRLQETAQGDVIGVAADLTRPDQVAGLVAQVEGALAPVEIVVCNAGGPPPTTFAEAPAGVWQEALELNLLSTVHLCRATVPTMRARGWGRVICLTSVAAKQPVGNLMLSTMGRAGILGFAKALSDEVAADGVTVNAVCPGYMHTERVDELVHEQAARTQRDPTDVAADLVRHIPIGRLGQPEELAAVVAFLASGPARYVTGTALQIDGGFVRSII